MEGDKEIFKAILEPLIVDPISEALKKQRLEATSTADDIEVEELEHSKSWIHLASKYVQQP
jgi:hypothetical protein